MAPDSRRCGPLAALAIGWWFAFPAQGAAPDAEVHFARGIAAFEAQSYAEALAAFEAALAAGLDGPAVHFNAGVAAYRSGDLARAEHAFRMVTRTPAMAPLAEYNLGLVALARNDPDTARRRFAAARDGARDAGLRGLAQVQLEALESRAPVLAATRALYAYAGGGHDDNVALVADAELIGVSGVADAYLEARLAGALPLRDGWLLQGGLSWINYRALDRFDQLAAHAGARYRPAPRGRWQGELAAGFSHALLDGQGFESRAGVTLEAGTPLHERWRLLGRLRATAIEGHGEFGGLSGSRREAELMLRRSFAHGSVGVAVLAEHSDHDDAALSSDGAQLRLDWIWRPRGEWTLDLGAGWRERRYRAAEGGRRSEDRAEFSAKAARRLHERWRIVLAFTHLDHAADLALYDFGSRRISAGIEGIF